MVTPCTFVPGCNARTRDAVSSGPFGAGAVLSSAVVRRVKHAARAMLIATIWPTVGSAGEPGSGGVIVLADGAGEDEDEVIDDPELRDVPREEVAPEAPPVSVRLELHGRVGIDTAWEDPREDVLESTNIGVFETTYRRSEDLRFAVGLRVRYLFARREDDSVGGRAERHELDVTPLSAYADATVASGVHLRAGYQVVTLGRFDVFAATDFLAVYDLRQGLTTMPEARDVAQPALRADIDVTPSITLQSFYVPFFRPHLVSIYGTDYSMLSVLDRVTPPTADDSLVSGFVLGAVERSDLPALSHGGVAALGVQPAPTEPQGAVRATGRFSSGEASVTAGTALERLPAFVVSPELEAFLLDPADLVDQAALVRARRPLEVEYARFGVISTDAALDAGPLQVGVEAAYMVNRTFYAARSGRVPVPERSDVLHAAARAELVEGDALVASVEAFHARALDDPGEPDRVWMTLQDGRYLQGVAGAVGVSVGRLRLEVAALASTGPLYFVTPRVEVRAADGLFVEAGAFFTEGTRPTELGQPDLSIGGIYDGTDQAFTGVRWLP